MVQIEELGKMLVQIVTNRNNNDTGRSPELIDTIYTSLKVDADRLLNETPDALRARLDYDDGCGLLRLEIAAKTLLEESHLRQEGRTARLRKARELLQYIQQHDTTFSLERVALLSGIEEELNEA